MDTCHDDGLCVYRLPSDSDEYFSAPDWMSDPDWMSEPDCRRIYRSDSDEDSDEMVQSGMPVATCFQNHHKKYGFQFVATYENCFDKSEKKFPKKLTLEFLWSAATSEMSSVHSKHLILES
jgi:hypothetical protein